MGPELILATTLLSGAAAGYQAISSSKAMNAQAAADTQKARIEGEWADRRAGEERAAAQRTALTEKRKADLAQSRLTAVAGASGSGAADPTVLDLWGDIGKEGQLNQQNVTAAGEQRASGLEFQGDLGNWTADANARIKRASAQSTLIGGLLGAGSTMAGGVNQYRTPMASNYSNPLARSGGTYYNDYDRVY